jgi:hypothetical protein
MCWNSYHWYPTQDLQDRKWTEDDVLKQTTINMHYTTHLPLLWISVIVSTMSAVLRFWYFLTHRVNKVHRIWLVSGLYSRYSRFDSLSLSRLSWLRVPWLSSVPLRICWDSILKNRVCFFSSPSQFIIPNHPSVWRYLISWRSIIKYTRMNIWAYSMERDEKCIHKCCRNAGSEESTWDTET